ncbi:PPP2R3B isoform 3, partial [Pan troglodytes]
MERAEPGPRLQRPARPGPALPRERGARPGPRRALRADGMRLRERSLRQDPDLRQELASLARGCDFVLPSRFKKRLKAFQQVQTRKEEPLPPATSQSIPTFYFPRGRPQDSVNVDAVISKIESTFARFPHERATMDDMGLVAKACGCPLYWKGPLFYGAGGERTGSVSVHKFVAMWRKILQNCHDDAAKFVHLLMSPGCNYLVQEDFVPFLQDVVNTHPGLSFLKEASEFHSRYITTVIQRIFYAVNRSWSGRITCAELRKSSFLQNVALLEEEEDINQLTEFFSYEHFYVIYCKFWELDTDHDLLIDADDLARHNDH